MAGLSGRDAADVPLTHSFGIATLSGFRVWAEEAQPESTHASSLNHLGNIS
jgi:hypothetical protein